MGSSEINVPTETYFGTKQIMAMPMTRKEYNDYRGWKLPDDEVGTDEGYLVEYVDGGASNHPDHAGYISWSPSEVFDRAYKASGNLTFGHAIEAMKLGHRVARAGWNGKGMWVVSIPKHTNDIGQVNNAAFRIRQVNGEFSSWVPSVNDCYADDWSISEVDF